MRLLIFVFLTLSASECFAENKIITACFSEWRPYSSVNEGRATGFSIELYRAVAKRINMEINFIKVPWKRCRRDVARGAFNAAVDGGPKIKNTLNAKRRPVPWIMVFWVKENSSNTQFNGFSQFDDKTVLHVRGYGYPQTYLDYKSIIKQEVTSDLQGLEMLARREVEAFFGDLISGTALVKDNDLNLRPLTPAVTIETLTLSFHESLSEEHKKFEAALNEMYVDGSAEIYYRKYLGFSYNEIMNAYIKR